MFLRQIALTIVLWFFASVAPAFTAELPASTDRITLLAAEIPGGFLKIEGVRGVGVYPDLIYEAADAAGVEILFRFVPWGRAFREVERSNHYLTFPLTRLPEREARYSWLVSLEQDDIVFVTLDEPVNTLEEARKLGRILVWKESSMESFLLSQGFTNIISAGKTNALIRMLAHRRGDAWFTVRPDESDSFEVDGESFKVTQGDVIHTESVWLAGGKGFVSTEGSDRFMDELQSLVESGRLQELKQRHTQTSP